MCAGWAPLKAWVKLLVLAGSGIAFVLRLVDVFKNKLPKMVSSKKNFKVLACPAAVGHVYARPGFGVWQLVRAG